ncbi:hypothetical protein [Arsenicibacter rosenii]|nr:hypothetical protein [Arsenicibacter rosenii]
MENTYALPVLPDIFVDAYAPERVQTLPFYFAVVDTETELIRFREAYRRLSGNEVPMPYLRSAFVIQFYRGWECVGGFVLNTVERQPLRYFSYLKPGLAEKLLDASDLHAADIVESCCNWLKPGLPLRYKLQFYLVMLNQARRLAIGTGKTVLMGGSIEKKVKMLQKMVMSHSFYHGEVFTDGGETNDDTKLLEIYTTPIRRMRTRLVRAMVRKFILEPLAHTRFSGQ